MNMETGFAEMLASTYKTARLHYAEDHSPNLALVQYSYLTCLIFAFQFQVYVIGEELSIH
jgi:hypothetical protein